MACFLLAGLFLLRLVPAALRRLLPFSTETQDVWRERRRLGKRYDSYQWRKLLWIGLGISLNVLFSHSAESGGVEAVVALLFLVPGFRLDRLAPDHRGECILKGDERPEIDDLRDPQNNTAERKARICMATWRDFNKAAFRCGLYEAEDVLMEVDDVDLISLEPGRMFRVKEFWQRRLLWHDVTKKLIYVNPGLRPVRLEGEYDLFVAVCQGWADLLYLNAVKGWKDHCRTSVCYIDELWALDIPNYRYWLHRLREFDHVILGLAGSIAAVEKEIGRSCHYVPGGVDALRFSPYPEPPERVIDVYSIGRRWEGVHQRLLQLASEGKIFYCL